MTHIVVLVPKVLQFMLFFYFFFQAEDGIRDYKVTGVQTCALPISERDDHLLTDVDVVAVDQDLQRAGSSALRSEERRVGKECRCRWWVYHDKKKVKIDM